MDRYVAERFYSNPSATQLLIDLAFVWMPLEKLSPVFKEGWTVIKESSAFTKSANYVSKILSESRAASITAKTEQVAVKALSQSERFSNTAKSTSAMGFTGRKGFELTNPGKGNTIPSTGNRNPSMAYEGRTFSGHAVDQMQNRGIPFSAANNAMLHGETYPSQQVAGRTVFYDAQNDLSVIVQDSTEKVVTVTYGKSK
jgi:hypothetical protein